jgi:septal ring factor EnvC (AmiA/AmiB activator)
MAEEFTKEQKAQLATWAEQRDELLSGISALKVEEEKLQAKNKELASSNSDIESRMLIIQGRIEELKIKESEIPAVISKEIALLESKKNSLQTEITATIKILEILKSQKAPLEADIEKALATFEILKGETLLLDKIVGHVTEVSNKSVITIDALVAAVKRSMQDLLDTNKVNVDKTNLVIKELPVFFLEAKRQSLERVKISKPNK